MGIALSDTGQELADLDGQLLKPSANGPAGRTLLTVLDQTQSSLVKVRLGLARAQKAAAKVDVHVIPAGQQAAFVKSRDTIASALAGLDEFDRLVPVLTDVLGGDGVRTILVEQVNPAELRAGGGFIGTYSLLRTDHGVMTVIKSGNAYDLAEPRPMPGHPGFIPIPSPYREVIPNVSWSLVDSNIYPDFPSNARAALNFVEPRLGIKLDGVISMDYYTVVKMLELTGPLAVPGFAVTVDSNNFISLVLGGAIAGDSAHKAILSAMSGPLMQRVSALSPDRWPALIGALNTLAAERHLQAFFARDAVESEIDRVGWSGRLILGVVQDFMMEVESNYYGDKVNYFLNRQYTVVLTRNGNVLHHQVAIDLVNNTVCGTEERTSYKANFRLYFGIKATPIYDNLRSVIYPNPPAPAGVQVLDGWLPDVRCGGGQGHGVFEYDTQWTGSTRGLYQIYWQKQPGTLSDKVDLTWNDGSGHTFRVSGDLGQDRRITLSSAGIRLAAGQPAQVTLPSLSLG
jgi:hypothetical protein